MSTSPGPPSAALLLTVALLFAGCSGAVVEQGPGGTAVRPAVPTEATPPPQRLEHTEADIQFMRDMIAHHAQALEMASLVAERTASEEIRMLARRIEVSQEDEIAMMRRWLAARGEGAPEPGQAHGEVATGDHHGHGHHQDRDDHYAGANAHQGMPGMLSHEQLSLLAHATGDEFDRLFLEFMILHHEGAITMVEALFSTEGAGQDTSIFQIASHVDSDQRAEILRMRRMLAASSQRDTE
jgi:uncharacterized protein (DUF305 family)